MFHQSYTCTNLPARGHPNISARVKIQPRMVFVSTTHLTPPTSPHPTAAPPSKGALLSSPPTNGYVASTVDMYNLGLLAANHCALHNRKASWIMPHKVHCVSVAWTLAFRAESPPFPLHFLSISLLSCRYSMRSFRKVSLLRPGHFYPAFQSPASMLQLPNHTPSWSNSVSQSSYYNTRLR